MLIRKDNNSPTGMHLEMLFEHGIVFQIDPITEKRRELQKET
jgi:hypothetical protein